MEHKSIVGILMMFRIYSQCKLTRHKLNADTVVLLSYIQAHLNL